MIGRVSAVLGKALLAVASLVGRALASFARWVVSILRASRAARVVAILCVVVLGVVIVDAGVNAGRAYPGVHVGEVDVSGKTADEIAQAVEQTYGPRLTQGLVTVYASDEAAASGADADAKAALAEQQTAEEERSSATSWTADASSLAASLPAADLATQALSVGRDDGGLPARLSAALMGWTIDARVDYGNDQVESLADDIDAAIGEQRVDYGIAVADGVASVSEGHDGDMVSRDGLMRSLDAAFLSSSEDDRSFVAHTDYAPVRIGQDAAQAACDRVNAAIGDGVRFVYDDATWDLDPAEVGSWIVGRVEERDGSFVLTPSIDEGKAKPDVVAFANRHADDESLRVSFDASSDGVTVHAAGTTDIPLAADTVSALDDALFGPDGRAAQVIDGQGDPSAGPVEVSLAMGPLPESLTFDDALDMGVIQPISSFTTEFTTGPGTENRNHNIALVSQLLDGSTIDPGGRWSFNDTAGDCNAECGFLGAGAILDGEYSDAVGGGICQVATTVFNAVYESGFPVYTRHNHSLYIASYPAGRDAAVSWPDLDLVWGNDSESAVLMRVTCADSSVTATLYGVSPGYQTSTEVGAWEDGEKHGTKTEYDDSLAPGTSYVKTRGTDGKNISVTRTVRDRVGDILREDLFSSEYDPVTEVVVDGPETASADAASSTDESEADAA